MTKRTLDTVANEIDVKVSDLGALAQEIKSKIDEARSLLPNRTRLDLNPNVENMLNNITMPGMGFVDPSTPS